VADFARYLDAPFQQFSVEHVSFFSETSLGNVLRRHGFEPLVGTRGARAQSESSTMPVLTTVAEKVAATAGRMVRDGETLPALEAYIERSEAQEAPVAQVIDDLVRSRRPIVVWASARRPRISLRHAGSRRRASSRSSTPTPAIRGGPSVACPCSRRSSSGPGPRRS